MYAVRVKAELETRLDAEFYNPQALAAEAKMRAHGQVGRLGEHIKEGYRVVYHGTDSVTGVEDEDLVHFLSPTQIGDAGEIDFSSVDRLPKYYCEDYPKGLGIAGELLVEVKGNVKKVAVLPDALPQKLMISGSLFKATLKETLDPHYALSFLTSGFGQVLKNRLTSNTIIQYIAKPDLYSVPVFSCGERGQRYIGQKVRQAERLRAWAVSVESYFTSLIKREFPDAFEDLRTDRKFSRALPDDIDYTLNPGAFDEERLRVRKYLLNRGGVRLSDVASIAASTSTSYTGTTPYLGLDAISSNSCHLAPQTVETADVVGASRLLLEGPVVSKLRPYLNKVSYIPSWLAGAVGSTELLCVQPKSGLCGWYLYGVLKAEPTLKQLRPLASGATHPRIDQYDLYHLVLPMHPHRESMGDRLSHTQLAYFYAAALTGAAKLLVESLIEAQLHESDLIAAQQALEAGDNSLDRAILARLKTDGIDGTGEPLFPDLDQLYDLLGRAAREAVPDGA